MAGLPKLEIVRRSIMMEQGRLRQLAQLAARKYPNVDQKLLDDIAHSKSSLKLLLTAEIELESCESL